MCSLYGIKMNQPAIAALSVAPPRPVGRLQYGNDPQGDPSSNRFWATARP
jgi:hypothetical protein